jgi:hypothetical protein
LRQQLVLPRFLGPVLDRSAVDSKQFNNVIEDRQMGAGRPTASPPWESTTAIHFARRLNLTVVPVTVAAASGKSAVRLALESNAANETSKPTTFVDLAETIWRLLGEGKTQQAIADELGWTRTQITHYAAVRAIDEQAWNIIYNSARFRCVT